MSRVQLQAIVPTVIRILLILMLVAPICVYVAIFGFTISDVHQRWAEMGSAMSGIYGPILSVLTLSVLMFQVRMQAESNKHLYDQAHLQLAHDDLVFYLCRLELQLTGVMPDGVLLSSFLQGSFMFAPQDALRQPALHIVAREFNQQHPAVLAVWQSIMAIYAGLRAVEESPYELYYSNGKSKAIALLSYETCVALDNYAWCLSRGEHSGPYCFASMQ